MNDMMLQATLLTRASRLSEATVLIQRMLRGETDPDMTMRQTEDIASSGRKPSIAQINATNDEEADDYLHLSAATFAHLRGFHALHDLPNHTKRHSGPGLHRWMQRAPVSMRDIVPEGGKFIEADYTNAAGSRAYKLYIPSRYQGQSLAPKRPTISPLGRA